MNKKRFISKKDSKIKKMIFSIFILISALGVGYAFIGSELAMNGIISLFRYGKPYIERDSWEEIIENVQSGNASRYNVGDTKEVDMGRLGTHILRVANNSSPTACETLPSKTACGFVLEFVDFVDRRSMNVNDTNIGGFPESNLYSFLNEDVLHTLPSVIRNAIIFTPTVSGLKTGTTTTNERIYLLSGVEVLGSEHNNDNVKLTHTRQLDYYNNLGVTSSNVTGAIKMPDESVKAWWLRSAQKGSDTNFRNIGSTGTHNGSPASTNTYGVTPAFRISDLNHTAYRISYELNGGEEEIHAPTMALPDSIIQISMPRKPQYIVNIDGNSQGATIKDDNGKNVTRVYNSQVFTGWTGTNVNASTAVYGETDDDVTTSWSNASTLIGAGKASMYFENLASEGNTVTLEAHWTENSTIEDIILPDVEKVGYACEFNTENNGTGQEYFSGDSYTPSTLQGNTTLYVICQEKNLVTLDNQEATSHGTINVTAENGEAMPHITIPQKVFLVTFNYHGGREESIARTSTSTFNGYYESPNGVGTKYYNADGTSANNWDKTQSATIYAYWTDGHFTLPTSTKTGYTFDGWYEEVGGTRVGGVGDSYTPTAPITLNAHWTAKQTTVTLDQQSGSGGTASITATYDQEMPTATAPTRTNYTFGGYYTGTNGSGTQYYNASMQSVRAWDITDSTKTLYAKWTGVQTTVTLDRQSGTGGSASVTATYGSAMPSATAPTRTNYYFGGYWTGTGGTGTQYYNASMQSVRNWDITDSTKTLYAYWDPCGYFTNDSWSTIVSNVKSGNYNRYPVGCTKDVELGNSLGTHPLRVANNSNYNCSLASKTACGFVLEFADIITTHNVNNTETNAGSWPATAMRTYLNSTSDTTSIINSIPSVIKNAIIDTTVVSGYGVVSEGTNFTSTDKLYLLSTREIWIDTDGNTEVGIDKYDTAYNNSTRQLDYYAGLNVTTRSDTSAAIKQYNGSNSNWWLRSPCIAGVNFFWMVDDAGYETVHYPQYVFGVSPAFRFA